jgi:hypothetical protein
MPTNVVKVGPKRCKPFSLQVMVFSPENGYKFALEVEQACTATNDAVWKLVFDLYKKQLQGNDFDQVVHVSFTAVNPAEATGIQNILKNGVSAKQADGLVDNVFPAAKALEDVPVATPEQKSNLHKAMSGVATANV